MDEIGIEQARPALGEIVDKTRFTGDATMITRQGKPAAVVVSAGWYQRIGALGRYALDMAQVKCPDCEAAAYPDDVAQALAWAMDHECETAESPNDRRLLESIRQLESGEGSAHKLTDPKENER